MPLPPPADFAAFDEKVWARFEEGMGRQTKLLLDRIGGGKPLPSKVVNGGPLVRETGRQTQYRQLVQALARQYKISTEYAQVTAWLSVNNAEASTRALQAVLDGTPAEVQRAVAGLSTGTPLPMTVPNPTLTAMVVQTTQQGILKGAVGLSDASAARVAEIIQSHVITGQGIPNTAQAIMDQVGLTKQQAINIARTQTADAYNAVTTASLIANPAVTHYEWLAEGGPRTCAICLTLDGQVFEAEVEPDVHNQCRCTMLPIDGEPNVTANGYNADGKRIRNGQEVPLDVEGNQAAARNLLPKSWDVPPDFDTTKLVGWKKNPDWRPAATIKHPARAWNEVADDGIITLAHKKQGAR